MQLTAAAAPTSAPGTPRWLRLRALLPSTLMLLMLALVAIWAGRPAPIPHWSRMAQLSEAGVLSNWRQGNLVVLVRHAERCDRSSDPCLADASGITVDGSNVASAVGNAFNQLGLVHADIYTSPLTRTVQTASFMFGAGVRTQDWLHGCRTSLQRDMLQHKAAGRNLVLVTHSDCIDELEKQLNASGANYESQYASTLFVAIDKNTGKPSLLGYLNADDWASVEQGTSR